MPTIPSRDRAEIIDEIRRYARERLAPEQLRLFETFVGQYYGHVSRGDLAARHVHDLYGAAMSHLTLAQDRAPGKPLVRVYSPDMSDTNGRFAKPRCFLYSISRSIGERAVTARATRSRRLTAVPFQEVRNEVHIGHGAWRCGPYIML